MKRKVVTKEQWLDVGLARFGEQGLAGLKVEAMARTLGSSKAGFYWYFKSRAAFEQALFEHWRTIETKRIIAVAELAGDPTHKLLALFTEVIHLRGGGDFLFHLRRLARRRTSLARLLDQTETERIHYLASVLEQLGKERVAAVAAAEVIYHLYLGWYERHRFEPTTPAEARKQLRAVSTLIGVELSALEGARP
jgi:AcrR family transcriptional regulator